MVFISLYIDHVQQNVVLNDFCLFYNIEIVFIVRVKFSYNKQNKILIEMFYELSYKRKKEKILCLP